jgi:hypothetical protein
MLMGMALGSFHHEMLIGVTTSVPQEVLRERILRAVRIFLRGTLTQEASASPAEPPDGSP